MDDINLNIKISKWILLWVILQEASDLHISATGRYYIRKSHNLNILNTANNKIIEEISNKLGESMEDLSKKIALMDNEKQKILKNNKAIDFALDFYNRRFRVNIYSSKDGFNMALRLIRNSAIELENFTKYKELEEIISCPHGLVLICGKTGSGKSTTLAALIHRLNIKSCLHIITLEDPIEYIFSHDKSLINQREYTKDFNSFDEAIRMSLREDADVIMVGEIRDSKTMKATLDAAEAGHLVFATLHARTFIEVILRIQAFFPENISLGIREQIASSLNAVILQSIESDGDNNIKLNMQIIKNNYAISNLIRKGKEEQINAYCKLIQG